MNFLTALFCNAIVMASFIQAVKREYENRIRPRELRLVRGSTDTFQKMASEPGVPNSEAARDLPLQRQGIGVSPVPARLAE